MLEAIKLRSEYKENPLGIDVSKPRISWQIKTSQRSVTQTSYHIQVAADEQFEHIQWDSGVVQSAQSNHVELKGLELQDRTRYYYRIQLVDCYGNQSGWSETAYWETAFLQSDAWQADWITTNLERHKHDEAEPLIADGVKTPQSYAFNSPLLRRDFTVKGPVKRARIYTTSLGLYELQLNGSRVGDQYLSPGWTSYLHRLQYQTYDVTAELQQGANAIGAALGKGWYRGNMSNGINVDMFGERLALLLELHVDYTDGSHEVIVTDEQWKSGKSAIGMSEIYHGETVDARQVQHGWSKAAFDDGHWLPVEKLNHTKDILVAQENEPVRQIEALAAIELIHTPAGETVIDFGQNLVGWVKFQVRGEAGTTVSLQHAEVLDKDGNFYTANLRNALQAITYTLAGTGVETFEPTFSFQGFRYVKLEGFTGELDLKNFTAIVLHSDMEQTGSFTCSEPLINQLQHNILWGQKGNFVDVPTDCPQRDERLGWTGDAQMFVRTATFLMNVAPFFSKWLKDVAAEQLPDGGIPLVVPDVLGRNKGVISDASFPNSASAWGDAAVICPWTIYLSYGDTRILETQYASMQAWVAYIRSQGENEFLWNSGFHFGDWLGLDAKPDSYTGSTDSDFIATAFYAYSTSLLARTAKVLGREADYAEYTALHGSVLEAFRNEFVTPSGRLAVPTQTAHVLALMFDLLPEEGRAYTARRLIKLLEESKYHLTTGFVGTPYLCLVLSRFGHNDAAYKLLLQTDYPSWLYQVTKGATTIWEHWDGIKEDGSFWSADMNSFNHYAYGSIGDWLYRVVAGIDTDLEQAGYKHITIQPQPGEGLDWADASLETQYGLVRSVWRKSAGQFELEVTIPSNTTATVVLPGAIHAADGDVTESGAALNKAEGVRAFANTAAGVSVELGSGHYKFVYAATA